MIVKIEMIGYEYFAVLSSGEMRRLTKKDVRNFLKNYNLFSENTEIGAPANTDIIASERKIVAILEDNGELRICSPELLKDVFKDDITSYLTSEEFAEKHERKQRIVLRLCSQGRIKGAIQKSSVWLIPEDAPYPADARCGSRIQIVQQPISKDDK